MRGERDARRRALLRDYLRVQLRGNRAALIRKSGLSKGRIAQLLDDEQPFGERAAQTLGRKLGLGANFFDSSPVEPLPAGAVAVGLAVYDESLQSKWNHLIPEQREEIMAKIDAFVRQNRLAHDQIEAMGLHRYVPDGEVAKHLPLPPAQRELLGPTPAPPTPKRKKG